MTCSASLIRCAIVTKPAHKGGLMKPEPHPPHITRGILPWLVAACFPIAFGAAYIIHLIDGP